MSCDRRRGRQPCAPPGAGLQSATHECVYAHPQSKPTRSQSAPSRLEILDTHKRRTWYHEPRTKDKADADAVNPDGEPQPPASSCASGIYKKLDECKRQIRILELHPGSGEDPISGNLITIELYRLPIRFDESIFVDELSRISNDIVFAVHSGSRVRKNDVDRWEFVHDSLIWLLTWRFLASAEILREARGTPTAIIEDQTDQLRDLGISSPSNLSGPALTMQRISALLETTLSKCSAHHSWTHDLQGHIYRFSQRSRDRRSIICLAKKLDKAINNPVSEDSDVLSGLTRVDGLWLISFIDKFDLSVSSPPFAAVSWFWGDADRRDKMELDGKLLDIPINAIRALRDLRDGVLIERLWIDAVCINQDDKAERASQILLMSDIYSFARLTYVWLGNEDLRIRQAVYIVMLLESLSPFDNDAEAADNPGPDLTLLKAIFGGDLIDNLSLEDGPLFVPADPGMLSDVSDFPPISADRYRRLEYASSIRSTGDILRTLPPDYRITRSRARWQSILVPRLSHLTWPLFELPWFGRLWVFQEAALSSHCTVVFGSGNHVRWNDLAAGVCLMRIFDMGKMAAPRGVDLIVEAVLHAEYSRDGSPLLELVSRNVGQECSNPRDYIFGLLGLTVWAKQRLRWPPLIQPNYLKSISDCMRDATRVMIEQEGNLSALSHWCQVEQSPTWAVYWHRHKHIGSRRHFWPAMSDIATLSSQEFGQPDLKLMEKSSYLNILLLKGHSIGFVHSISPPLTMDEDMFKIPALSSLERLLRCILDLSTRTGFEFSPRTIALTLMTCGRTHGIPHADRTYVTETQEFRRFESVISNLRDELCSGRSERCLDLPLTDEFIITQCYDACQHCRLFTTQAGQLCVGPEGVQEGDKIVRLFGLPLPALLRPEQSWFTFAGVVYIDRGFPVVQDTSTLPPEIFEIR